MATSVGSVYNSSDLEKDYVCDACESKNIEESADYFCARCIKFFCGKCIYQHDQLYANHSKYGRGEANKWPLSKTMEDLLLKCDVHKEKKLKTFCQDHSQLCCSDCVLMNHRQCTNVTPISEAVKKTSLDMQQLSINLQTILGELNKFKSTQEASIQFVEVSYSKKLQEIEDMRKKLNAALDALENATLEELDKIRTTLQTSLKNDVDNCRRLKDELKELSEAVNVLCDKSKKEIEFIARRKCLDKIQKSEIYLKENPVKEQISIIFKANIDIVKYLSQQASLGKIIDRMKSFFLNMNPDHVMTMKSKCEYIVRISSDRSQTNSISGICCLPSGLVIVTDEINKKVKLLDQHYNVYSHCDVSGEPCDICQITSNEVAVSVTSGVQFISVSDGKLVNGRKFELPYGVSCIAHHQGALYITGFTALYQYTLAGSLVKKLYEEDDYTVSKCAVSPAGDRIYVTSYFNWAKFFGKHKLITLSTDGTLISTFTDLQSPNGIYVTPSGQVLVCENHYFTGKQVDRDGSVIQVDREGRKQLATLVSQKDGVRNPMSVCYNSNMHQIIIGLKNNNKIIVIELQ